MHVKSIRREIRLLRYYALGATLFAAIALLGAAGAVTEARNASFDTITAKRLIIRDNEGKLAMVLTNHDTPMPGIIAGKTFYRHGGGGNEIIFYNELGNEQGGFIWDGKFGQNGTYDSGNVMSYDSVTTDQLLQVHDGNSNGKMFSFMTGWNEPNFYLPRYQRMLERAAGLRTASQVAHVLRDYPDYANAVVTRYLFGYDTSNTAQVMLADAKGKPRIKMFVQPDGTSALQFLDANGKVVAQYPQAGK